MRSSGNAIRPSSISLQEDNFPEEHLTSEALKEDFGRMEVMGYVSTLPGAGTHQRPASPTCQKWEAQKRASKDPDFVSRTSLVPINFNFQYKVVVETAKPQAGVASIFLNSQLKSTGGFCWSRTADPRQVCGSVDFRDAPPHLRAPTAQKEILAFILRTFCCGRRLKHCGMPAHRCSQVGSCFWFSKSQLLVPGYDLLSNKWEFPCCS